MANNNTNEINQQPRYVYGLSGLARLIGCSKPTAHKIKNSGAIPFFNIGKKFIFDEEKVMAALAADGNGGNNG